MAAFRFRKGLDISYVQQGYVYFTTRNFEALPARRQDRIRQTIQECGGPYEDALRDFLTTDAGAVELSMRYHISERTLYRIVARYYRTFLKRKI